MFKVLHTKEYGKSLKKLKSWATGTVTCGPAPLQRFLENTAVLLIRNVFFYLAKRFLEKQSTTR